MPRVPGAVARIDDHGQVSSIVQPGNGSEREREAGVRLEGADTAPHHVTTSRE